MDTDTKTLISEGMPSDVTEDAMKHFYGPGFDKILPISSAIAAELFETSQKVGPHDACMVLTFAIEAITGNSTGSNIGYVAAELKELMDAQGEEAEALILKAMATETASIMLHKVLWSFDSVEQVSELRKNYLGHLRTML